MQLLQMALRGAPLQLAETLLYALIGGLAFELGGLPAGLVSGSVVAVAIAALLGRQLGVPPLFARIVLMLLGVALGSMVTPETVGGLTAYPQSIAILTAATLAMMFATAFYLRLVHGWDEISAILGASPGALSQVIALSAEPGVDARGVAVVQTFRVVLLAGGLPLILTLVGFTEDLTPPVRTPRSDLLELAILIGVAVATSFVLDLVRFPGAWLFGAMLGSGVLHGAGLIESHLPWWLSGGAMIAVGGTTGARFAGTSPRLLASYVAAALGSFAVSGLVAAAFAGLTIVLLALRPSDVVIAFAPGAQETMMLLALALHLDPVFVGAHHLSRFVVVSFLLPTVAGVVLRRRRKREAAEG